MEYIFILGRVLLGGYFIRSGINHFRFLQNMVGYAQSKGVMMPKLAVSATGLMLLLGGVGVLLGVYVQWAVILLTIFLIGVTFKMHQFWTITDPMQKMGEEVNFYKNLALLGAVLMLLAIPLPWALSLF
jgi:uncharacterized membrane protein YphA (DoxX/SURF4 family)